MVPSRKSDVPAMVLGALGYLATVLFLLSKPKTCKLAGAFALAVSPAWRAGSPVGSGHRAPSLQDRTGSGTYTQLPGVVRRGVRQEGARESAGQVLQTWYSSRESGFFILSYPKYNAKPLEGFLPK